MVGPELESRLFTIHGPEGNEDTGSSLLSGSKSQFLQFRFTQETPVSSLPYNINADAAALVEMPKMVGQQVSELFGEYRRGSVLVLHLYSLES
jgi:hypothetical protein